MLLEGICKSIKFMYIFFYLFIMHEL